MEKLIYNLSGVKDYLSYVSNKLSREEVNELLNLHENDGDFASQLRKIFYFGPRALYPVDSKQPESESNDMFRVGRSFIPNLVYQRMKKVFADHLPDRSIDGFLKDASGVAEATAAIVWTKDCVEKAYKNCPSLSERVQKKYGMPLNELEGGDKSWARGTGFLIGKDLLLTAAHNLCTPSDSCHDDDFRYVFGYQFTPAGRNRSFRYLKIFNGKRLRADSTVGNDWRLVKLAESPGIQPISIDLDSPYPNLGDWVWGTGYPGGIPQHISPLGQVTNILTSRKIVTNLDFFGGNSGSPVLSLKENKLIGILKQGSDDYEKTGDKMAFRRVPADLTFSGAEGEIFQPIASIANSLQEILKAENLNYQF